MSTATVSALHDTLEEQERVLKEKEDERKWRKAAVDREQGRLDEIEKRLQHEENVLHVIEEKMNALRGLPESGTSQALRQQIETLREQHREVFAVCAPLREEVKLCRAELGRAKLDFAVAQQAHMESQKQYDELHRILQRESQKQ